MHKTYLPRRYPSKAEKMYYPKTKQVIGEVTVESIRNQFILFGMEENYIYEQQSKNTNLLFLDLDRFKYINDTYGHKIGDFILRETGQRLRNLLRNKDIICRYGGHEFIIIIITDQLDDIINIANRIIQTIQQPFEKEGNNYHIEVSIGIAMTDTNTNNIEALIKSSDEAMYKAKKMVVTNTFVGKR